MLTIGYSCSLVSCMSVVAFPLLVDRDLDVARAYGAKLGPLPLINRTVVGIAQDGTIAFYKRGSPATSEILAGLGKAAV